MANQPPIAEQGTQRNKQPNSNHCFVCGLANSSGLRLAFYELGEDTVIAETEMPEQFQGFPGVVHGGVLAAMLDEVAGRAAMIKDHNRFFMTAKMTLRYRQPVPVAEPLRIVGRLSKDRGRIVTATAQVILPDGSIGAEAEAIMVDFPIAIDEPSRLEALGWKVYPD